MWGYTQSLVSPPVQRQVTVAGVAPTRRLETVYTVTLRGPIFPATAAALHTLVRRGFAHAPDAVAVQAQTDPTRTFASVSAV
jgi:hypothetical protein